MRIRKQELGNRNIVGAKIEAKRKELGMKQIESKNREELLDCCVTVSEYKGKYIFKEFYIAGMLVAELEY